MAKKTATTTPPARSLEVLSRLDLEGELTQRNGLRLNGQRLESALGAAFPSALGGRVRLTLNLYAVHSTEEADNGGTRPAA